MVTWYNATNFTEGDGLLAIFRIANDYTANLFGTLFLLGFFVVLLIVLRVENKHKITLASWTTAIVGIIYVPLGIMNQWVVYFMVIVSVIGVIGLFVGE